MVNFDHQSGLYEVDLEHSSCGVGFLTRKDGKQTHDLLELAHEALCSVPHRGGMSSEGVGDGAGVSVDLSANFFSRLTKKQLKVGEFGVGNFFLPSDVKQQNRAVDLIEQKLKNAGFSILLARHLPVDEAQIGERSIKWQLPIRQWIFVPSNPSNQRPERNFEQKIHRVLLEIESVAYVDRSLEGTYPNFLSIGLPQREYIGDLPIQ